MDKTPMLSYNKDVSFLNNVTIAPGINLVIFYTHFMNTTYNDWNIKEHSHSFYEVHVVLDGKCSVKYGDESAVLMPNSYIFIPPETMHRFEDCSDDFFRFSMALDIVKNEKSMMGLQDTIIKQLNEKGLFYVKNIIYEHQNNRIGFKNVLDSMISCLAVEILRLSNLSIKEESMRSTAQQNLSAALEFIDGNLSRRITLSDVSNAVHLSTRQLDRIFKDSIDVTVTRYIKSKKLENVKEYLEKTDLSIKEISGLTGFGDEISLCKLFKKQFGVPCSEYRKRSQNK